MSNSSRIEAATRQHVGAVLTNEQIADAVKLSFPDWKGGIYPSDCAYTRQGDGLAPRGKQSYGDGVLEYLGANSFKVLPTEQIIRRPGSRKEPAKPEVAKAEPAPVSVKPVAALAATGKNKKTPKSKTSLKSPVVAKQKARDTHVSQ